MIYVVRFVEYQANKKTKMPLYFNVVLAKLLFIDSRYQQHGEKRKHYQQPPFRLQEQKGLYQKQSLALDSNLYSVSL